MLSKHFLAASAVKYFTYTFPAPSLITYVLYFSNYYYNVSPFLFSK
jgi:hypothetical protein